MEAIIGFGANAGCREQGIARACSLIEQRIGAILLSPVYETLPLLHPEVPTPGQPEFLNAVAVVESRLGAHEIMAALLSIETELGRKRGGDILPWSARPIDLDLLAFGELVLVDDGLVLPHPRLHQRDFVLRPLADLCPNWTHPVTGQKVEEMLAAVDQTILRRFHAPKNSDSIATL